MLDNKYMEKRGKYIIATLVVTIIFAFCGSFVFTAYAENDVSICLRFGSESVSFLQGEIAAPDYTIKEELSLRRIGAPREEVVRLIEENLRRGYTAKESVLYCFPRLKEVVGEFVSRVNKDAKDAEIVFRPYNSPMFTIRREAEGYSVNEERLYYDIYAGLRRTDNIVVDVAAIKKAPSVTAEELCEYTHKRASFSTGYSASGENRKHNIRLALSKINGKRIENGDEFSFNAVVGKRTTERGFQEAKIIVGGDYADGVGGGVCQASTTVYNCALLAGMTVTSVAPHSLPPSYVQPSLDAMVNSGSSDLKFKNDTGGPVFIKAYGTDSTAIVEIYGKKPDCTYGLESKIVSRGEVPADRVVEDYENKYVTPEMQSGQTIRVSYGNACVSSEGYLTKKINGKIVERRLIRRDVYKARSGIVAVKP